MSIESDLLRGLAQWLHDRGLAVYKPSGGYVAADTAVVFGDLPSTPDRAVALTVYGAEDETTVPVTRFRVQVWCRGAANNSLDAGDLADSIFVALQGLQAVAFGTVEVNHVQRISRVTMGVDGNKRSERADSYAFDVDVPATAGRPG